MRKQYFAPDLKLAGEAEQIVLGGGGGGTDLAAEDFWDDLGYASDEETPSER